MFKKLVVLAALGMFFSNVVRAENYYFAPSIFLNNVTASNSSANSNYRGISPRAALGVSSLSCQYYGAAEFFLSTGAIVINDDHTFGASIKTTREVGLSVIPGLLLNSNTIGTLRLGVTYSWFNSLSISRIGEHIGVGLMTKLNNYWSVRGEYIYTTYNSINNVGTPHSDMFALGLVYKIA